MPKLDDSWMEALNYDYDFFIPKPHDSSRVLIRRMNSIPNSKKGTYAQQQFNRIVIDPVSDTHHMQTQIHTEYKRIDAKIFPKGNPDSPSIVFEHTATLNYSKIKMDGPGLTTFGPDVHRIIVCGQQTTDSEGDRNWARDNNIHIVNLGCNTGLPSNTENAAFVSEQISMLKGIVRFFANGSTLRVAA